MNADEIWAAVDAQRRSLADLLEGLTAEQWTAPSLCDGWRVRDVAAHLTHSHMPPGRMLVEALKSGFRFDPMIRRLAVEDTRSQPEIVAALRGMVGSRRKVPGTSVQQPLIEVLVHGQDIAVPLGIDLPMPPDAAVEAAKRLAGMNFPLKARQRLDGTRLVAADADFAAGKGSGVTAPIRDIVMVLAGRADS
ncbi:MAG: maleylpyruvate isomerase family mycothiol-dependent enzyme [Mycobacterium sp.]|nr:maleylpyruvate isomerase family mycothiol-dependent enzyme [Mycobacterium sp.]